MVKTAADSSQLKAVLAHDWHDGAGHPVHCAAYAMSETHAVIRPALATALDSDITASFNKVSHINTACAYAAGLNAPAYYGQCIQRYAKSLSGSGRRPSTRTHSMSHARDRHFM